MTPTGTDHSVPTGGSSLARGSVPPPPTAPLLLACPGVRATPPPRPAASSLRSPSLAPLQPPGKSPIPSLIKMPSSPQRAFLAATPLPQPAVWSHRKATLTLSPVGLSLRPQNPSCPQSTHPNPVFPEPSPESTPPPSLPGAPHRHRGPSTCAPCTSPAFRSPRAGGGDGTLGVPGPTEEGPPGAIQASPSRRASLTGTPRGVPLVVVGGGGRGRSLGPMAWPGLLSRAEWLSSLGQAPAPSTAQIPHLMAGAAVGPASEGCCGNERLTAWGCRAFPLPGRHYVGGSV